MRVSVPVQVVMDDGREIALDIDQRDMVAAEGEGITRESAHAWVRYLAFNNMVRTKQYSGTWQEFNTVDCVQATDVPEESGDDDDRLDPGQSTTGVTAS